MCNLKKKLTVFCYFESLYKGIYVTKLPIDIINYFVWLVAYSNKSMNTIKKTSSKIILWHIFVVNDSHDFVSHTFFSWHILSDYHHLQMSFFVFAYFLVCVSAFYFIDFYCPKYCSNINYKSTSLSSHPMTATVNHQKLRRFIDLINTTKI